MIKSSLLVKCLCVAVASVVVAGAASLRSAPPPVTLDGGGEAVEAALGTSFADMSIGTLAALTPEQSVTPLPAPSVQKPVMSATSVTPTLSSTVPVATTPLRATTSALTSATAPALQTLAAAPEASASPQQSSRPKQRDPVLAAKAAPKPAAKPKATAKKATKKVVGKSIQRAKKGTATGTKKARAASKGKKKATTTRSGKSAAAAKYPNQVMRRIARVSKPRVNSRGTAVVAFSVSGSGGLARLSIARSSGSSKLDQAALRVIKKAAPFPAPPRGAQRSFSIRIKGR
jgi:protein TonB